MTGPNEPSHPRTFGRPVAPPRPRTLAPAVAPVVPVVTVVGAEASHVLAGTPEFRRINLAVFAAGYSIFLLMYAVQPLLPIFTQEFHVTAATSSLALSLTTACLAVSMLVVGAIGEGWARKPIMTASLFSAALLTLLSSVAQEWPTFLLIRTIEGIAIVRNLVLDGKFRALGGQNRARTPLMPDMPTMAEAGVPGAEANTFYGVVAPVGTPASIIKKLNEAMNQGLATEEMQKTITSLGSESKPNSPEEFAAYIAAQNKIWIEVGKAAGVQVN